MSWQRANDCVIKFGHQHIVDELCSIPRSVYEMIHICSAVVDESEQ